LAGHVAFSPVTVAGDTGGWYGLGPISVWPELQRKGIGSALIHEGLRNLKELGALGCALIGNPDYYCQFGFVSDGNLQYKGVPDEHVQWLSFNAQHPVGQLVFNAAFGD